MLDETTPQPPPNIALHPDAQTQACIDACTACAVECCMCAAARIDLRGMAECARTCLDCADACQLAASAMSRDSPSLAAMCALCADVCERCTTGCELHAEEHDLCRRYASAARESAALCRAMSLR